MAIGHSFTNSKMSTSIQLKWHSLWPVQQRNFALKGHYWYLKLTISSFILFFIFFFWKWRHGFFLRPSWTDTRRKKDSFSVATIDDASDKSRVDIKQKHPQIDEQIRTSHQMKSLIEKVAIKNAICAQDRHVRRSVMAATWTVKRHFNCHIQIEEPNYS